MRVNALPSTSFTVGAPLASVPPAIEICAPDAVTLTSRKVGIAAGKSAPRLTLSETPLTEIAAPLGFAAAGVAGCVGVAGAVVGCVTGSPPGAAVVGAVGSSEVWPTPCAAVGVDVELFAATGAGELEVSLLLYVTFATGCCTN